MAKGVIDDATALSGLKIRLVQTLKIPLVETAQGS